MDWTAFELSIKLAAVTVLVLLPLALWLGRWLATTSSSARLSVEALVILPLVLPPTVLGFYLLMALGSSSPLASALESWFGVRLVFTFEGLVFASVIFNLPFMVQPLQRAFEAIPDLLREAAMVSGLSAFQIFWRVELPLIRNGLLSAIVLTLVHTVGEFGVVLMIGGNLQGETRTLSIALYDSVQAFEVESAHAMAAGLLVFSVLAVMVSFVLSGRAGRRQLRFSAERGGSS